MTCAVCAVPNCRIFAVPKSVILTMSSAGQHQVRGLDVAVHDIMLVREIERGADLLHQLHDAWHREGLVRIDQRLQAAPLHKLHGDVEQAFFFAGIEDHDDIRVGQAGPPRAPRFGTGRSILRATVPSRLRTGATF